MNQSETLSPVQRRAIRALLECRNITTASKKSKVGRSTLQRWMRSDVFMSELRTAETELLDNLSRSLLAGCETALTVLYRVMVDGETDNTKRKACNDWISKTVQLRENYLLEDRLTKLEVLQNERETETKKFGRRY